MSRLCLSKLLLTDRRLRLQKMDIIEACECLRAWYGPPPTGMFDEEEASEVESEQPEQVDIHMMDEGEGPGEVEQELQILDNGEMDGSAEGDDPIVEDNLSLSPVY
jgi:hypothetical protein